MGPKLLWSGFVLLCLALVDVRGYVLRDRSWDDDNTLADALQVISRERRRLADEQYSQGSRLRPYYWDEPRSEVDEPRSEVDEPRSEDDEAAEAERMFLSRLFEAPARGSFPEAREQEEEEEGENDIAPAEEKKAVKRAELEGIFQPVGKRSPGKGDGLELEDGEVKALFDSLQGGGNNVELDEGQVKALLEAEEEAEQEAEQEADEQAETDHSDGPADEETEEVSEGELEDILSPEGKAVKVEDVVEEEEEPEEVAEESEWPEGINKEWLVEQYMEGQPPNTVSSVKRKRSDHGAVDMQEEEEEEEEAEESNLALLKQYLDLEDDENSNLALALNQATKAQISPHASQYIPEEIEYLQKAIADEEEIQKMRQMLGAEDEDEEEPEEEGYLQEPAQSFLSDDAAVVPMEDKRTAPVDLDDDEMVKKLLADRLQEYFAKVAQTDIAPEREEEGDNEVYGGEEWDNAPLPYRQEGIAEDGYDLNPFLRELMQKYHNGELEKRGDQGGYDGAEFEENNMPETAFDNVCPAIELSTNDCAAARGLGLALDEEAMDLCNRHQTCYTCGAAHGLSADDCDTGYLKEADLLCGDSEDCKDEAAALFVIMVEEHGFVSEEDAPYPCGAGCTFNYIVGGGGEK